MNNYHINQFSKVYNNYARSCSRNNEKSISYTEWIGLVNEFHYILNKYDPKNITHTNRTNNRNNRNNKNRNNRRYY